MKVGTAMNMLSEHDRLDVAMVQEHFALGDLVEWLSARSAGCSGTQRAGAS